MSAQFFGRSGKVLYGAFSIVGMAYQSQNVNNGIPDDRVARSMKQGNTIVNKETIVVYIDATDRCLKCCAVRAILLSLDRR